MTALSLLPNGAPPDDELRVLAAGALGGNLPVRAIWAAVLERALEDLAGKDETERVRVERWLAGPSEESTFALACAALDTDPVRMRRALHARASRRVLAPQTTAPAGAVAPERLAVIGE